MRFTLPPVTLALLLATSVLGAAGQTSTSSCDSGPACATPQTGGPPSATAEAIGRADAKDASLNTAAVLRGSNAGSATKPAVPGPVPQPPKEEPAPFHSLTDF